MKHWDLFPGENVTIESRGKRIEARFLFRDTMRACFEELDDMLTFRQFILREDGGLKELEPTPEGIALLMEDGFSKAEAKSILRHRHVGWVIKGEDRHTRGRATPGPEPPSRRAFAAGSLL